MSIACVRVPQFALRVALLDQPELDGAPLVLSAPLGGRSVVADVTPEAAARGIRPGMALREVTALCPEASVMLPNPVREAAVFEDILNQLEALSPLVEPDADEPGCCYVDLRGLERLSGAPAHTAARLLQVVPPILRPRAGVAPGKFAARVAAGHAKPGTPRVVDPQDVRDFLAEVSVSWLPLPPETRRRLERLGLRTLGELAALPGSAVAARFGPAGRHAWDLAQGRGDRRVKPRTRDTTVVEELTMPAPAVSRDMLLFGIRQLVLRAFSRPVLRGRHVRQVRLRAQLEGGRSWEKEMTLREPMGGSRLIEALDLRLHTIELSGAVEAITLELSGLTGETARQEVIPGLRPRQTPPLTAAVRHLKQRYGLSPVYRVMEVEPWSRIPERRHALISYDP